MIKPNTAEDRARMSQVLAETIGAVDENNMPIVNRREIIRMYYVKYGFTKSDIDKLMTEVQPIPPPLPPEQPQGVQVPPELIDMLGQQGGQIVGQVAPGQSQMGGQIPQGIPPELEGVI